jgi:ribosomal protein L3 glutamine methyltransferase
MGVSQTTVEDLIRWAAHRFNSAGLVFGHGTDNALDEAAALVLYVMRRFTGEAEVALDSIVTESGRRDALELIESRIITRKPAAYLIREAWFAGLPFYVDERVLVPRSPLAELVGNRFIPWVVPERVTTLLDLCTGSGCIGIACAHAFPRARVTATDISLAALAVARRNIEQHALQDRVWLLVSSLFAELGGQRFDIIVTNPPYVPQQEFGGLPPEYRHEPSLGLVAGDDGLDIVVQILDQAAEHLSSRGILVVEVGCSQQTLIDRFPAIPFTWLEFEHGGEGVFLLERCQLDTHRQEFARAAAARAMTKRINNGLAEHG